jgi:hypothetical protein
MTAHKTTPTPAPACADAQEDILEAIMAATLSTVPATLPPATPALSDRVADLEAEIARLKAAQAAQAVSATVVAKTRQPAQATAAPVRKAGTLTAFPKMLRGGQWGARVHDGERTPRVGDRVTITTRKGKTWTARVTKTWGRTFAYERTRKATPKRQCPGDNSCRIKGWPQGPACSPF